MNRAGDPAISMPSTPCPRRLRGVIVWGRDRWLWLTAASWLVSGLLYLTLPPSWDQFNHAYMGWRLLMGDAPYRDFIDSNWPGVMALHALAIALFGVNLWSWRALDFLLFLISALFLADLARLVAGRGAAKLSLFLLPLIYVGMDYWMSGQHDMSAAQFLAVALWFHVRACQRRAVGWQLATGLFIGAAMLNKPTVGVIMPLLLVQMLWLGVRARKVVGSALAMATGLLAAVLAAAGAVLLAGTSARELIESVYRFNLDTQYMVTPIYGKRSVADVAWFVLKHQLRGNWVLVLGSLPALFWLLRRGNRSVASTVLPLLWFSGVASCLVQSHGIPYHLAPSVFALAAMLPISIAVVADGRVRFGRGVSRIGIPIALGATVAIGLGNRIVFLYGSVPRALASGHYEQHLARFSAGDGINLAEAVGFAQRLSDQPPTDCVFAVGTMSAINYLSQRPQPTRFYYFPFLYLARPPVPMADRWVGLWEADLSRAQCHYVLIADWIRAGWLDEDGRGPAALRRYLGAYREAGTLGGPGGMTLYERN